MTQQGKAATQNWARANRLAELADVPTPTARNYLTTRTEEDKEILDSGADKRNPTIKEMIEGAQAHTNPRPSAGDPNKPARAGARTHKIPTNKCVDTSIDLLLDIKKLADKHGGLETLSKGLQALQRLRD